MDESESLAERYLLGLRLGSVIFEPDGNVPPDFLLDGRIGVEVRRLNQNYLNKDGSTEGLEELGIPLWQGVKRILPSVGASVNGESWFVGLDFRRPLGKWKPLEAKIKSALRAFMQGSTRTACSIQITPNLTLDLIRAGKDHGSFFLLGASSDDDSGGWIMGELERNLRLCIADKERKIEPYRKRYSEWWLVLADHIDYGMDLEDREVFLKEVMPRLPHTFQKIVLIDPRDHRRAFEI